MPKNKTAVDNKFLKSIDGEFALSSYALQENFIFMNFFTQFQTIDKEFFSEVLEDTDAFQESMYGLQEHGKEKIWPLRMQDGTVLIRSLGGGRKEIEKIEKLKARASELMDDLMNSEGADDFKDFLELVKHDVTHAPGEYADAYMNSLHLSQLVDIIGAGPKFVKNGERVSFKKIKEVLTKPDGSGFLVPYLALCKSTKRIWDLEMEKVRNDRLGWTPESEADYLKKYRDAIKSFNDNFDKLKKVVKDNPGIYDEYLDNPAIHLVDYARDHNKEYGQFKGQIEAIDNGWGIEELNMLGACEELNHMAAVLEERYLEGGEKRKEAEEDIARLNAEMAQLKIDIDELKARTLSDNNAERLKDFDELNAEVIARYEAYQKKIENINKSKEAADEAGEKAIQSLKDSNKENETKYEAYSAQYKALKGKKDEEGIKALDEANKDVIKKHLEYKNNLSKLEKDISNRDEQVSKDLDTLKKENETVISEYKTYKDERKAIDYAQIIEAKNNRLNKIPDEIKNKQTYLDKLKMAEDGFKGFKEKYDKLKKTFIGKKVTSAKEKREVYEAVTDFFNDIRDMVYYPDNLTRWGKYVDDHFGKAMKIIETRYDSGITHEIEINDFAKERLDLIMDIYGPRPFHHPEWETSHVISQKDMYDSIKRYETQDLPFSEKEMAVLGMAGTLIAKDEIIAANGGEGREFEDVLSSSSTRWMEDVSIHKDGPREDFGRYRHIVAKGRENAVSAMKDYANGDPSGLCEIIYNGMVNVIHSADKLATFGEVSVHQYLILSTLTDMLRNDQSLRKAFDEYNNSMDPDKKVDIEKAYSIRNFARMRVESINATRKFNETSKKIEDKLKKDPEDYEYNDRELDAVELALHERNARHGRVIERMFDAAYNMAAVKGAIYDQNQQYNNDAVKVNNDPKARTALEDANYKFVRENYRLNPAFVYLGTKEGKEELQNFSDMLSDKYGVKYADGKLCTEKGSFETDPVCRAEFNKFICELANKQILLDLFRKDVSKDKMKELAADYMINNYRIQLINNQLETGYIEESVDFSVRSRVRNIEKHKGFEKSVKGFVSNMDVSDIDSREFAKILSDGKNSLLDTTNNIEILLMEMEWSDPKKRAGVKFPSLDESVRMLEEANKGVLFGSKEYKNILDEMKKLNEDAKKAEERFKNSEEFTYDARGLAKRENELINKLDKYIERKNEELAAQPKDKKNATSLNRKECAEAALKALKERLKAESKLPTVTEAGREEAKTLSAYVENSKDEATRFTDRGVVEKPSGMEIINDTLYELDYQRIKIAKAITAGNTDRINLREVKEQFVGTVRDALYYELLKNALAPKEKDSQAVKAEKDVKLKAMLKKGSDSSAAKMIDGVMKTKYGMKLADEMLKQVIDPSLKDEDYKGIFDHDTVIKGRDYVFVDCFNEEMEKYTKFISESDKQLNKLHKDKNRSRDFQTLLKQVNEKETEMETNITNLCSLAANIGSKALEKHAENFIKMKNARIERNKAREGVKAKNKTEVSKLKEKNNNGLKKVNTFKK